MSTDPNPDQSEVDEAESPAGSGAEPSATGGGNAEALADDIAALGKVRELLFGTQARETSARLEAVEQGFGEALARHERDLSAQLEQLGSRLLGGLDVLTQRLEALETLAQEQAEQTAEAIRSTGDSLGTRIDDEAALLRQALGEARDEFAASLDRTQAALEAKKVDREQLSSLFSELASRVDDA